MEDDDIYNFDDDFSDISSVGNDFNTDLSADFEPDYNNYFGDTDLSIDDIDYGETISDFQYHPIFQPNLNTDYSFNSAFTVESNRIMDSYSTFLPEVYNPSPRPSGAASEVFTQLMANDRVDPFDSLFESIVDEQKTEYEKIKGKTSPDSEKESYFSKLLSDPTFLVSTLALIWNGVESRNARKHQSDMLAKQEEFERSILEERQAHERSLTLSKFAQESKMQQSQQNYEKSLRGGAASTSGGRSVFSKRGDA